MKKLLILSGKGGTGKTTTAAAFLHFSRAQAFADCDVDAPNLHLVVSADGPGETSSFYGSEKAAIDPILCIGCGVCADHCRFDAIRRENSCFTVNEYACEGCGVCVHVCPRGAAQLHPDLAGDLQLYRGEHTFSTARLRMGRGNSGKLVSAVKSALFQAAPEGELAVIDGSPGIGCPVISSVSGVDMVLLVTEPSLSALSDLKRITKTAAMFCAKLAVCINKYDISEENTTAIETFCAGENIPCVGRIPYDKNASQAINAGVSIAEVDCPARNALLEAYRKTITLIHQ